MQNDEIVSQDLDYQLLRRIGPICDAFEAQFREGTEPVIEAYLTRGTEHDRGELLYELLKLDHEYRVTLGKQLPFANYVARFPNDEACLRSVFMDAETIASDSTKVAQSSHQGRDLPKRLGKFELLEVLGQGGMGVVYRANQFNGEFLFREVALKLVRMDQWFGCDVTRDGSILARFREEAHFAAKLKHPNIVEVYDVGQIEGLDFFSMQLILGTDLFHVVKTQQISFRKAAEMLIPIAQAISFAHGKGIVHRDLKPSNILVDSSLKPYIADFGLAKSLSDNSDLTRTGQILGTPGYMAPEQAAGKYKSVGPSADIYGLGGLLYFCLTGQAPFVAENVLDTLVRVLESDPIPPRTLNKQIPRTLELIAMRCLEKKPEDRYKSASEVAEDLERFLHGLPAHAKALTMIDRLRRFGRRSPVLAAHLSALGLALFLGQVQFALYDKKDFQYHIQVTLVTLAWIFASVICGALNGIKKWETMIATIWLCADAVFLTTLVSMLSTPIQPPGAILIGYPMVVVGGGMFFRSRMVILVTIVTMLSYIMLLILEPYMLQSIFPHTIFLVLLACMGMCNLHQVRRFRILNNYLESRRNDSL